MKISVLVFVISVAYISSLPTSNDEIQDAEKFCVYKNVNISHTSVGPGPVGECVGVICTNAEDNTYILKGCKLLTQPPKHCKYTEHGDLTLSWPDCCPYLVCQKL